MGNKKNSVRHRVSGKTKNRIMLGKIKIRKGTKRRVKDGQLQNRLKLKQQQAAESLQKNEPGTSFGPEASCSSKADPDENETMEIKEEPMIDSSNYFEDELEDPLVEKEIPLSTADLKNLPMTTIFDIQKPDLVRVIKPMHLISESTPATDNSVSVLIENPNHEEDSYPEDTKDGLLEITDTRLTINVEHLSVKECDLFGAFVSQHLQKLPLDVARKLQADIQGLVFKSRLQCEKENRIEIPVVAEELDVKASLLPNMIPMKRAMQSVAPQKTYPPSSKRQKPTIPESNVKPAVQSAITKDQQNPNERSLDGSNLNDSNRKNVLNERDLHEGNTNKQKLNERNTIEVNLNEWNRNELHLKERNRNERTEHNVFAEHVSEQLKSLPEETSIQLQSQIYELLRKSHSAHEFDTVRVKTEVIDETLNGSNENNY